MGDKKVLTEPLNITYIRGKAEYGTHLERKDVES